MVIKNSTLISEVQEEFRKKFPYLKLEFYSKAHKTGEGSPAKEQVPPGKSLGQAGGKGQNDDFKIFDSMQVCELEQQFEKVYGLHVQVWRKSGTLWLQTIATDEWTLEEQNIHGKQSVREQGV
jgi:hypothetical protein